MGQDEPIQLVHLVGDAPDGVLQSKFKLKSQTWHLNINMYYVPGPVGDLSTLITRRALIFLPISTLDSDLSRAQNMSLGAQNSSTGAFPTDETVEGALPPPQH